MAEACDNSADFSPFNGSLRLSGGVVKLGITAPDDVSVLRTEVDKREDLVYPGIVRTAACGSVFP